MPDPDNDYFETGSSPPEDTQTPPAGEAQEPEEESAGATALLPKSILQGKDFKPGDEVVLKITHVYGDEIAVEYAKEPASEHPMSDDEELEGMDTMKEY